MFTEEWREIPGYEGIYEVSSFGRVRSVDRIDPAGRKQKGKMRKLQTSKRGGYPIVNLRRGGKVKSKKVHHLVASAYIGPPPMFLGVGGIEVNHDNGIKTDNHPWNLEYCTRVENIAHAVKIGLRGNHKGDRNGRARLTEAQVIEIRALYSNGGTSIPKIAAQFGVGKSTIGYIIQGVTWKHLPRKSQPYSQESEQAVDSGQTSSGCTPMTRDSSHPSSV